MLLWLLTAVNAPILIGCAALSDKLVPILLGQQWGAAVPLLQILCIVGLGRAMGNPIGSLLLARGRADLGFYWNFGAMMLQVPIVYIGASLGGAVGVAYGVVAVQIVLLVAKYTFLVRPLIGPCLWGYMHSLLKPTAVALVMGIVVILMGWAWPRIGVLTLALQIAIGAIIYISMTVLLEREHMTELKVALLRK
jgi:O-antigen/teichoic acid export membrane protein